MTNYAGPGDILVAAVNRTVHEWPRFPGEHRPDRVAACGPGSASTTWAILRCLSSPADAFFAIVDTVPGLAGNWMIRASGVVTPVELQGVSIE